MPHKPLYFPIVLRLFFNSFSWRSTTGARLSCCGLTPVISGLEHYQSSLLLISRNISTISLSPAPAAFIISFCKHEISEIILSVLINTRLPTYFPLTPSGCAGRLSRPESGLDVVGRDYKHNHQSVSANAAFSLVLSPPPLYRPIPCQYC